MKAVRMLFLIALTSALCFSPPTAAPAAAASALLHVSATILPWVELSAHQNVATFHISEADLTRGYVDLPTALRIQLRSNVPESVVLRVSGRPRGVAAMQVAVAGAPPRNPTMRLTQPAPGALWSGDLLLRLLLAPEATTGTYPLQTTVTAEAY